MNIQDNGNVKRGKRLIFVHDGPIFYDNQGNYYEYSYHRLLERYSYIAEKIVFLMRTTEIGDNEKYTVIPKEIDIVSVPNINSPKGIILNYHKVKCIIKEEVGKSDILVARGGIYSDIAIRYAKENNIPFIYECVGCPFDSLWNHSFLGKLIAPLDFLRERRLIKKSEFVYYVTSQFLQKRYPTNGISIACSNVVLNPVNDNALEKRLIKIRQYNEQTVYKIGTAAALDVRYKGQEYVIKAISILRKKGINIEYYMAGGNRTNSSYLEDLAEQMGVKEYVYFVGSLDSKKMLEFYDMLDLYIQPSKQEGLPRSVIEAMSRGLPALGSNIAGIPELLQTENLFRKGNVQDICKLIEGILSRDMTVYAKQNYERAKDYQINILEEKRHSFYDLFLEKNF